MRIVHDHLIGDGIRDPRRAEVERIDGRKKRRHTMLPGKINGLPVRLAREGKQVVRLKAAILSSSSMARKRLTYCAQPGFNSKSRLVIAAASGMSCHAGIPLAHRTCAHSRRFATRRLEDDSLNLDLEILARTPDSGDLAGTRRATRNLL